MERANTNEEVYRRANEQLKAKDKITKLSNIYLARKQQLYCQVATAPIDDPIRRVSFEGPTTKPMTHHPRRIGRPKVKWAHTEAKEIWDSTQTTALPAIQYNPRSEEQARTIHALAKLKLATSRGRSPG